MDSPCETPSPCPVPVRRDITPILIEGLLLKSPESELSFFDTSTWGQLLKERQDTTFDLIEFPELVICIACGCESLGYQDACLKASCCHGIQLHIFSTGVQFSYRSPGQNDNGAHYLTIHDYKEWLTELMKPFVGVATCRYNENIFLQLGIFLSQGPAYIGDVSDEDIRDLFWDEGLMMVRVRDHVKLAIARCLDIKGIKVKQGTRLAHRHQTSRWGDDLAWVHDPDLRGCK